MNPTRNRRTVSLGRVVLVSNDGRQVGANVFVAEWEEFTHAQGWREVRSGSLSYHTDDGRVGRTSKFNEEIVDFPGDSATWRVV